MLKAYQISLLLFTVNVCIMMMTQYPLFGSAFTGQAINMSQGNFTYQFNSSMNTYMIAYDDQLLETANFSTYQEPSMDEFGILEVLITFVYAMWNSTLYLPWFLNNLGFDPLLITAIVAPVWFVYGAGLFQIIRGLIFED